MSTSSRLTEVLQAAPQITFDDADKFIFFSDCHRGDNSWADDSAHNQTLMFHALQHYYRAGHTYIEVGDGDELLENANFAEVRRAHSHLYWLLSQFHHDDRFYLLFGNHNIAWKNPARVARELSTYYDDVTKTEKPLFDGITVHEGLLLTHQPSGKQLFVVHGHQGDFLSETLWPLNLLITRFLWKPLQLLGIHDPTSPAQSHQKRGKIEQQISAWITAHDQPTLCGHTHRPVFPDADQPPYYNTGSGVHPRCITGIEIAEGTITLIKWWVRPDDNGFLRVTRDVLEGPRPIAEI